jgi:hypothetical protein
MLRYLPFLCLLACSPLKTDEKINAKEVNQEIKDRKIKRVVDDEVVTFAYEKGTDIAGRVQQLLKETPCTTENLSTQLKQDVLLAAYVRCEGNTTFYHEKEQEIWEAYQQAWGAGNEPGSSIQRLGEKGNYKELLYAVPFYYNKDGKVKNAMLSLILSKKELIRIY